jgi:hypothetical protein
MALIDIAVWASNTFDPELTHTGADADLEGLSQQEVVERSGEICIKVWDDMIEYVYPLFDFG